MRDRVTLPPPSAEAMQSSRALSLLIADRIAQAGGWIGLADYLAMALYEPGLGYYAGGSRKFGAQGDFVTAPEMSPLFGACLARQCAEWFEHCPARVLEFGAGSGALAGQVLGELARLGYGQTEYWIVELSGELAARQRERIAREQPEALARVRWLDRWPDRIEGVVLANELLDAMPVRGFLRLPAREGEAARLMERGVCLSQASDPRGPQFEWSLRPADADFAARVLTRLGDLDDTGAYLGEIGEQAEGWMAELTQRMHRGAVLLIDYGFSRREFYHPQRSMGTLMCHYRHHAHDDLFFWPGLQDITAHVDFSAIAQAARAGGLHPLGFVPQSRLLSNLGLLDMLATLVPDPAAPTPAEQQLAWARQTQAVQRLLSEAEMGELFKAIAFATEADWPAAGFERGDRMSAL